jgi:hypothetical protein
VTFNPVSPGSPIPTALGGFMPYTDIACPSVNQCTAIEESGREVTFNPSSPGTPTPIGIDRPGEEAIVSSIACPSLNQCTVVDEPGPESSGREVTFDPTSPGHPKPVTIGSSNSGLSSVACPSTSLCVAVDTLGNAVAGDPSGTLPPENTALPTISGAAQQGQTLTESHGSWSNEPIGYSYQWWQCDSLGNGCVAIAEATSQTYMPVAGDVGHTLEVQEVAANTWGSSNPAISSVTAIVAPAASVTTSQPPTTTPASTSQGATVTATQPNRCVVPRLIGRSLALAKRALGKALCGIGHVHHGKRPKNLHRLKDVVVSQSPKAGRRRPVGTKVALWLAWRK